MTQPPVRDRQLVDTSGLRAALDRIPAPLEEDVSTLPTVKYHGNRLASALGGGSFMASLLNKSLGIASMVPMFMSGGGMSTPDYYKRYNLNPRTAELLSKGYRLLFVPELIRDLNTYMNTRTTVATGFQLLLLAQQFDEGFSPRGDLAEWMTFLVRKEFVSRGVENRRFNAASSGMYANGGMRGGYNGAYWGMTQFGADTYAWVYSFANAQGLKLPATRQETSFEQQLVAAYVLAVLNQSLMRPYIKGELLPRHFYIAHNQGAGVFKTRTITKKRFDAQSINVRAMLREEGFTILA